LIKKDAEKECLQLFKKLKTLDEYTENIKCFSNLNTSELQSLEEIYFDIILINALKEKMRKSDLL
jgi:hypothetical protein